MHLHRDCNAISNAVNISPCVPSTCAQNPIPSLFIIHIVPSCQIYVAIDNPSLIPSLNWVTTGIYLWNYVCAADNISNCENLESNGFWCFSHLYKFRDGIEVTRVFRYCGKHEGEPVLNESAILVLKFNFE